MFRPPPVHEVAERLIVGPCPASPEIIARLRGEHGVGALVSLQTDGDLERSGLSWPLLWRFLVARGITPVRVPIIDFDDRSLLGRIDEAADAVQHAHGRGDTVYLHCTAGVNRSPTVAIAWLVRHRGMSLDDAWEQVTTRRPCDPHRAVLERWSGSVAKR